MEKLPKVLEDLAKAGFRVTGNPEVGVVIWDEADRAVLLPNNVQEAQCLTSAERIQIAKKPNPLASLPANSSGAKVDAATNMYLENLGGLPKIQEYFRICEANRPAR